MHSGEMNGDDKQSLKFLWSYAVL